MGYLSSLWSNSFIGFAFSYEIILKGVKESSTTVHWQHNICYRGSVQQICTLLILPSDDLKWHRVVLNLRSITVRILRFVVGSNRMSGCWVISVIFQVETDILIYWSISISVTLSKIQSILVHILVFFHKRINKFCLMYILIFLRKEWRAFKFFNWIVI